MKGTVFSQYSGSDELKGSTTLSRCKLKLLLACQRFAAASGRCCSFLHIYSFIDHVERGKFLPKNEEISRGKAHTNTWKLIRNILTITDAFLDQKRVNVCEHMVKMASLMMPSIPYVHIHLVSSDRERQL